MADEFLKFMGEFGAKFDALHEDVKEIKADAKITIAFQAATEERLKQGAKRFENHEQRICVQEEKKCPRVLKPAITVTLITVGFTVLGLIIAIAGK